MGKHSVTRSPKPALIAAKTTLKGATLDASGEKKISAELTSLSVKLKVVTLVHGGATHWDQDDERKQHVRKLDKITPMRVSAIRGQLRFWWRATHGCLLGSIAKMREAEATLWGAASRPGLVSMFITDSSLKVRDVPAFEGRPPNNPNGKWNSQALISRELAYGAFAMQPKAQRQEPEVGVLTKVDGTATLEIRAPKDRLAEVQDALDAWLLFGGIGGRTRRGFGAVMSDNRELPSPQAFIDKFQRDVSLPQVPSLHHARVHLRNKQHGDAQSAHEDGLNKLRAFRQEPNVGRNKGQQQNRPGRSWWPEPDYIRKILPHNHQGHQRPYVSVDKMPRASFGMPIIFHFKDAQEPVDSTLKPVDKERMASPLILRPVRYGNSYRAMALTLFVPGIDKVPLELNGQPVSSRLTADDAAKIKPIADNDAQDALSAFLNYFRK